MPSLAVSRLIAMIFVAFLGFIGLSPALAEVTLPKVNGPVVLTVSGLDPDRFEAGSVSFDIEGLASLGSVSFVTSSIWTEGAHEFSGIPLTRLAEVLEINAEAKVLLRALNDYAVEMPLNEAEEGAPIVAYHMDGKPMSVRDKGPLWIVYPYDSDPDKFQTETAFGRSVWQLDRIEVVR